MKHQYTMTQQSCGWPAVYKQVADTNGASAADDLVFKAEALYEQYAQKYSGLKGIKKLHCTSAAAFGAMYLQLKELTGSDEAVRIMEEAAKPASVAKHNKIEKIPAGLFMKVVYMITSIMFGEKAGFKRTWHTNTYKERSFDLLTCPYVDVLKSMGCPEVCPAICIQDDYSFTNLKNGVIFERKKTLGRGDDCCDFCYRLPTNKSED